jgi:hypothetical protein
MLRGDTPSIDLDALLCGANLLEENTEIALTTLAGMNETSACAMVIDSEQRRAMSSRTASPARLSEDGEQNALDVLASMSGIAPAGDERPDTVDHLNGLQAHVMATHSLTDNTIGEVVAHLTTCTKPTKYFFMDTGASNHLINNADCIIQPELHKPVNLRIRTGNAVSYAKSRGPATFLLRGQDGKQIAITRTVIFCPEFHVCLTCATSAGSRSVSCTRTMVVNTQVKCFATSSELSGGTKQTTTVPRSPNMNPLAEGAFWRLFCIVRALLADSGMSKRHWGASYLYAAHLNNRTPRRRDGKYTTAYELVHKRQPSAGHIRVFGCT